MKMPKDLLNKLEYAVNVYRKSFDFEGARREYAAKGLTPKRFRWDVLWALAKMGHVFPAQYYAAGLDDRHIDTALRKVVG